MRANATKFSTAYYRTAVRRRGRNVTRIYAHTPRDDLHGTWIFGIGPNGPLLTAFTKDGNFWWVNKLYDRSMIIALRASPTPGRLWDAVYWTRTTNVIASWNDIYFFPDLYKGALGPFTGTLIDSFTA